MAAHINVVRHTDALAWEDVTGSVSRHGETIVTSAWDVSPAFEECAEAPFPTTPCNQKQSETVRRGKKACKQKISGS
jgi:hypothetical protein